jgi:hypothetical protein
VQTGSGSPIQSVLGFFPFGYSGRSAKLITHLFLELKLRMRGFIPQLPIHLHNVVN